MILSYPFAFIGAYTGLYLKKGENRNLKRFLTASFAIGAVALLSGPFLMNLRREAIISQKANEFTFKVRHNVKGTPIRGNNLWLQFEANRFKIENKNAWDNNQSVYVSFERDSLGFARIQDVTRNQPVRSVYWIKTMGIRNNEDSSFLRINYPFSNYLLDEKIAREAERVLRSKMKDTLSLITLKVYLKENSFLVSDLKVDGVKFSDFVRNYDK
jgi:hypothetical protein